MWPFDRRHDQAQRKALETQSQLEEKSRAILEEKNRILAVLASMTEGVAVIDAEQRILLANSVLAGILGIPKTQLEDRFFWEAFRDPQLNEMLRGALENRVSVKKEHSLLLSNSFFEVQVSPVNAGREFLGVVAVFHDVTRLKELERLRAEFVANVSHELKTPLTSILGFVETLKEGAGDDEVARREFLEIIDEHSRKLHALIEDLLFLSELESGQKELKKERVDIDGMIVRVLRLFERAVRAKSITLEAEIQPKPFYLSVEPKSMEEALSNLLDNAIKYSTPGGKVAIRASLEDGRARIAVSDTGIGIAPVDLPRIFERFYRADKSRSRESGGTGLGLAIVKHIIERHSGRVEVQSTPQRGSTFTITLPL